MSGCWIILPGETREHSSLDVNDYPWLKPGLCAARRNGQCNSCLCPPRLFPFHLYSRNTLSSNTCFERDAPFVRHKEASSSQPCQECHCSQRIRDALCSAGHTSCLKGTVISPKFQPKQIQPALKKKKKVELVYLALFFNMQLDNMKCIKVKTNHPNDVLENREWKQVCSKFPCSSLFVMRQIWTVSGIKLLIQSNLGSSCSPLNLYLSRKQDFRSFSWQGFHSDLNEEESVTQTRGRENIHRDLTHCIYICN